MKYYKKMQEIYNKDYFKALLKSKHIAYFWELKLFTKETEKIAIKFSKFQHK